MPSPKSSIVGILLVTLATLSAACGANASVVGRTTTKSPAAETSGTRSSSASTTGRPPGSTTSTSAPTATTSPGGASGSGDRSGAATTAFCEVVARLNKIGNDPGNQPPDPSDLNAYLAALQNVFAEFTVAIDDLDSHAPTEIKSDVDFLMQVFDRANAALQNISSIEELRSTQAIQDVSSDAVRVHIDKVSAYAQRTCGFGFSDSGALTTA